MLNNQDFNIQECLEVFILYIFCVFKNLNNTSWCLIFHTLIYFCKNNSFVQFCKIAMLSKKDCDFNLIKNSLIFNLLKFDACHIILF